MSGDGKRGAGHWPQATAPILDSTEAGFFGAAASLSVYWGFKRPDQHFGYDAVRDEVDGASQGIEVP